MTKTIALLVVSSLFAFSALACNGTSKSTEGQTTTQTSTSSNQSVKR